MEQEWRWSLAGNIVESHEYGEGHEVRYGNRQFRPGAKVYISLVFGGMGHENILAIGTPRHTRSWIEIVIKRRHVRNFRLQKVYRPAVLKRMEESEWEWPDGTEASRERLMESLRWLQGEEAKNRERSPEGSRIPEKRSLGTEFEE